MKNLVISVVALFSMFVPTLGLVSGTYAASCGVKLPETLLALYRNSDAIYTAKFEGREDGKVEKDGESYSVQSYKRHFSVTSTLKGADAKKVSLDERDYIFNERQGFETIEQAEAAQNISELTLEEIAADELAEMKPGEDVLLFVRKEKETGNIVLTDYRDGLKRLPRVEMAVYEARIKELGTIFAKEMPDAEAIVDWLVRCAQDPVTRWEGVYELDRSFDALEYRKELEEERKAKIANGETPEDEREYFTTGLETGRTTIFAELLNEYQKQTLANILLNGEFQSAANPAKVRGNSELMQLVSRWADHRMAGYFISRLRSGENTSYEQKELINAIASVINDKQIDSMMERFGNIYYQSDDEIAEASDLDEPVDEEEVESSVEDTTIEMLPTLELADEASTEKVVAKTIDVPGTEAKEKVEVTYKQLRQKLVDIFILRAENCLTDPMAMSRK